ncbi:alpha/beta hydrolase [Microbacterium sp. ZW CA_36]|uniref:alpha/beta hydrolase n=1 Tax=Microbacterium sp. ZW CA_36 TaxID=3378078 RepID=UPI0038531237
MLHSEHVTDIICDMFRWQESEGECCSAPTIRKDDGVITGPPIDPEIAHALAATDEWSAPRLTLTNIPQYRARQRLPDVNAILEDAGMSRFDCKVATFDGVTIEMSVVQGPARPGSRPLIYFVHGGGMITGHRWAWLQHFTKWSRRYDAVIATIEYRLAPEHPDPAPVEDVYAGLVTAVRGAEEWGADPERILVVGVSAGGGLAVGAGLMARDRHGPAIMAQLLAYPMLDDRDETTSTLQVDGRGRWDRAKNRVGWEALLGSRRGSEDVSVYAAPGRADDLSGLPPTYLECGSAEVFRDEDVAFASKVWAAGGELELHVWPGGVHAFESLAPEAAISRGALSARAAWLDRVLLPPERGGTCEPSARTS